MYGNKVCSYLLLNTRIQLVCKKCGSVLSWFVIISKFANFFGAQMNRWGERVYVMGGGSSMSCYIAPLSNAGYMRTSTPLVAL